MIESKADLDALWSIYNVVQEEQITEYRLSFWQTLKWLVLRALKWVRDMFYQPIPSSLHTLTIGALDRLSECEAPSEVMAIIFEDLGIKKQPSIADYTLLFYQFNEQIKKIERLFKNCEIHESGGGIAIFNKISAQMKINPFAVLIDQMARRYSILPQEASKLTWAEVYFALLIDKQNYLVEREYNKLQEAEIKRQQRR